MSQRCDICGKGSGAGASVSHSMRPTQGESMSAPDIARMCLPQVIS